MDIVKSSAALVVFPEEVVRFQALKPRWETRHALVCERESVGVIPRYFLIG
jgi:hypothetical protein